MTSVDGNPRAGGHFVSRALSVALIVSGTAAYVCFWSGTPPGYSADTASIVLNATCLRDTGQDEYGIRHPIAIRSFGDYKQPLYSYLLSICFRWMEPTLENARLFSMLAGWLAAALLLAFYLRRLAPGWPVSPSFTGLAAFTLLTSSWLLVVQRFPAEVTLVPLVSVWSLASLFALLRAGSWPRAMAAAISHGLAVGVSLYTYPSTKIFYLATYPIVVIALLAARRRGPGLLRPLAAIGVSFAGATALAVPMFVDLLGERTSITRARMWVGSESVTLAGLWSNLGAHLSGKFLFWSGDANLRHHDGFLGEINLLLLPFLVIGLVGILRDQRRDRDPFWLTVLPLSVVSFLPACIANEGVPHALRTNLALAPLFLVVWTGCTRFERWLDAFTGTRRRLVAGLATVYVIAGVALGSYGVYWYREVYPSRVGTAWDSNQAIAAQAQHPVPVSPFDHSAETVYQRMFAVTRDHDLRYCQVYD